MRKWASFLILLLCLFSIPMTASGCDMCAFRINCREPDCVLEEYCKSVSGFRGFYDCQVNSWGGCTTAEPCQWAQLPSRNESALLAALLGDSTPQVSCSFEIGL